MFASWFGTTNEGVPTAEEVAAPTAGVGEAAAAEGNGSLISGLSYYLPAPSGVVGTFSGLWATATMGSPCVVVETDAKKEFKFKNLAWSARLSRWWANSPGTVMRVEGSEFSDKVMLFLQNYLEPQSSQDWQPRAPNSPAPLHPQSQEPLDYVLPPTFPLTFDSDQDVFSLLIAAEHFTLPVLRLAVQHYVEHLVWNLSLDDLRGRLRVELIPLTGEHSWPQIEPNCHYLWASCLHPRHSPPSSLSPAAQWRHIDQVPSPTPVAASSTGVVQASFPTASFAAQPPSFSSPAPPSRKFEPAPPSQFEPVAASSGHFEPPSQFESAPSHFEPAPFAAPSQFESAPFTQPSHFEPASFTQPNQFEPTPFTQSNQFEPAPFTQPNQFEPTPFTQSNQFESAPFAQPNQFEPTPFTQPNQFESTPFAQSNHFEPTPYAPPSPGQFEPAPFASSSTLNDADRRHIYQPTAEHHASIPGGPGLLDGRSPESPEQFERQHDGLYPRLHEGMRAASDFERQDSREIFRDIDRSLDEATPTVVVAVQDATRTHCSNSGCRAEFSMLIRKHHCRSCGEIFCWACSNHWVPPSWVPNPAAPAKTPLGATTSLLIEQGLLRVCVHCHDQLKFERVGGLKILSQAFALLTLDMYFFWRARLVSPAWFCAASSALRALRALQLKPDYSNLTAWEQEILWNNRDVFVGHHHWMLMVARSMPPGGGDELVRLMCPTQQQQKVLSCSRLKCSPDVCRGDRLSQAASCLSLLRSWMPIADIRRRAVDELDRLLGPREVRYFLPVLYNALAFEANLRESPLLQLLFSKSRDDARLRFALWGQINVGLRSHAVSARTCAIAGQVQMLYALYLQREHRSDAEVLRLQDCFVNMQKFEALRDYPVPQTPAAVVERLASCQPPIDARRLLFIADPELAVERLDTEHVKVFSSATRPVLLPLVLQRPLPYATGMIFKPEDVRKDQVVTLCIQLFADIVAEAFRGGRLACRSATCRDCSQCPLYATWDAPITYDILPLSPHTGLLECVPNCIPLAKANEHNDLQNWLLRESQHENYQRTVRPRHIRSLAFWTVVCYLLGIGDRHSENLMIRSTGELFHIDFGFVLGDDPKPMAPPIRITQELVTVVGGKFSEDYDHFVSLTTTIWLELRQHLKLVCHLLLVLVDCDPPIASTTSSMLYLHLEQRFRPGYQLDYAIKDFQFALESAWNSSGILTVNDMFRSLKKQ